jgi:hypothetical protein
MFNDLKKKNQALAKIHDEIAVLTVKRGAMYRTPRYDESYSPAKINNWTQDIENLQEKETRIFEEIAEVKGSPAFIKDVESKALMLDTKRTKIKADLDKVQKQLETRRLEMAEELLNGSELGKLAADFQAMQERAKLYVMELEIINSAQSYLSRMSD